MLDSSSKPLKRFRVRFRLGNHPYMTDEIIKAPDLDKAFEAADELAVLMSLTDFEVEVYDISQID